MAQSVEYYLNRFDSLKRRRLPFESLWRDLAHYIVPQRAEPFNSTEPDTYSDLTTKNKRHRTYDTTAEVSLDIFSSSLVGFLANPATTWFEIEARDSALMEDPAVAQWFDMVTQRMLDAFNEPRAKFYSNLKMNATDIGVFGTVGMWIQEGQQSFLEFSSINVKQLYVAEDASGNIDTVYRFMRLTARQLEQKFGKAALSGETRSLLEKKPDELVEVLHVLEPRTNAKRDSNSLREAPIKSVWLERKMQHLLSESGFFEMPLPVGRWDVFSEDIYGMPPAAKVLNDIKMLNQMEKSLIVATEKILNPPLQMPDDGFLGNVNLSAGAINVYRAMTQGRLEPINTIGNMPITQQMSEQRRNMIRDAFFVDRMQLMEDPRMTATEVMARTDERLRLMAPMIGRVQSELLSPIIERSFAILFRMSADREWGPDAPFNEPPAILMEQDFKIKFVSPLARAQKASESQALINFVSTASQFAQLDPGILDNINFDEFTRRLHDISSVDSVVLNDRDAVEQARVQRAQQQEQQQQMQQAQQMAELAETASDIG